jgi:hypothetical protein
MKDAKQNEDKIINMQAKVRGFLQRKNIDKNKNKDDEAKPQSSRRGKEKLAGGKIMVYNKGKPIERGNL